MLLILDDSLASELEQGGVSGNAVLAALAICAQQVREGVHILFADRAVYRRLGVFYNKLDDRTAAVLRRAEQRLPQLGNIRNFAERAIRIVATDQAFEPCRNICGKRIELVISVTLIEQQSSLVGLPLLMTENLNDGRCYLKIAKSLVDSGFFPELAWLSPVAPKCELALGGGNTLATLFSYHKDEGRRIGLAIADSDIRYPGGALGQTAAALEEEATRPPQSVLVEHLVLESRTIENCIPRSQLRVIMSNLDSIQSYRFERQESLFANSPFWKYVPLKTGVRCFELSQSTAESRFWTALLGERHCTLHTPCETKKACTHYVLPPVSDKILWRAVESAGGFSVTQQCLNNLSEIWQRLIILLYSFFCGSERVTVF